MNIDSYSINWFEIPVIDMERAKHFYQKIFSIHMDEIVIKNTQMAFFPKSGINGKASGALAKSEYHLPGSHGTIIYLNGDPDLSIILNKVSDEGGQVVVEKAFVNEELGCMAVFTDLEGNRIGLHSQH